MSSKFIGPPWARLWFLLLPPFAWFAPLLVDEPSPGWSLDCEKKSITQSWKQWESRVCHEIDRSSAAILTCSCLPAHWDLPIWLELGFHWQFWNMEYCCCPSQESHRIRWMRLAWTVNRPCSGSPDSTTPAAPRWSPRSRVDTQTPKTRGVRWDIENFFCTIALRWKSAMN